MRRALLLLLLLGSLALNAVPLWWGAHSTQSWAFDELMPGRALHLESWPDKYPPLYRTLLRTLLLPLEWMDLGARLGWSRDRTLIAYLLLSRAVSAFVATGTVWLVYCAGRRLGGWWAGWLAGATIALSPSFVYYAKTANLETPYLFFVAGSVLAALCWLERRSFLSAALMAISAAAAIAVKTSAYALYPLWPLAFMLAPRWPAQSGERRNDPHPVRDWRLWAALLVGCVALALFLQLPWRPEAVGEHVAAASRAMEEQHRQWPNTTLGHLGLFTEGVRQWSYVLSRPLSLVAVVGLALLFHRRDRRLSALLIVLSMISYYGLYITPIGFQAERYYLPLALLAAVAAGYALSRLSTHRLRLPARIAASALLAILLGWAGTRAVAVDLLMLRDSRLQAERWLAVGDAADEAVSIGRGQLLPRGTPVWPWDRLYRNRCDRLRAADPEIVFVSPRNAWDIGERNAFGLLVDGHSGLRRVRTFPRPSWFEWFIPSRGVTNLDKISPTIIALSPAEEPCHDRAWAMRESAALLRKPETRRAERLRDFLLDFWHDGRRTLWPRRAVATGLNYRGWTYGSAPAALALINSSDRDWQPRVELKGYVATPKSPQPVQLLLDGRRHRLLLANRGWRRLQLAPLAPGERRLVLLKSERFGKPSPGSRLQFGVRVRVRRPRSKQQSHRTEFVGKIGTE